MQKTCFLAIATAFTLMAGAANALIIIDNSTQGYYNAGLGDLALDSGLGAQTDAATGNPLFPGANSFGGADPVIPPNASEPNLGGADAGTQAALGNFLGNTTALGGAWSAGPQAIPATWAVNTETAIVYEFTLTQTLTNFTIDVGIDNGVYVWLDGNYLIGAMAPGGAVAFEYSANAGTLAAGQHFLQILREDHGGGTGYTIRAQGDAVAVTEPPLLLLLGLGLAGIFTSRRR